MATDRVYEAFYDHRLERGFLHSHSYSGNPLACRAALAVLDVFEEEKVLERNRRTAAYLNRRAAALRSRPEVEHFRNTGMIWAFEVRGAGPGFARDFSRRAIEAGVLLRPLGSTVYWMPPYAIESAEIDVLVETVAGLLDRRD
jgi:adenosylmethionine-8-amino-7-oxononanoate aminotransferase